MVKSPRRSEYYPVYFVEPYKGNEIALGFDLASDATRKESLERARDTGQLVATRRIKLVQETSGQFGFLVFASIYGKGSRTDTIPERRKNLKGFALGVFRIADILDKSLTYLKPGNIITSLYEAPVPDNDHLLYLPSTRSQERVSDQESEPMEKLEYRKALNVAGQEWLMIFETGPHYIAQEKSLWSWVVLIFGLLLTGISSLYMMANLRHTEELSIANEELEARIEERTADLARVNELLQEDITDRKLAEEALKKAETKYRIIFENAMEGIYQSTSDGRFLQVNPAMARIYGYDSSDDMEHSVTDIAKQVYVNPDDRKYLKEILEKNNHIEKNEYQVRRKNGDEIWISNNARAVRDNEGKILYFEGLVQDITERKQVEHALQESEKKYRNLVENVSDVIYEIDSQGAVIYISPVIKDIMGYDQADIVGKSFIEFVYKDDRNRLIERFFEFSKGIEYPSEYRLISKSGNIRWIRSKTSPIMESGSFKGARGTLIDITERKLAEEKLHEAHRRLDQIIDFLPDATGVIDADGKVIAWNRAMEQMTGVPKAEMIGKGEYEYALPFYGERRPSLIDLALLPDTELEKRGYNIAQRSEDTIYGEVYVPNLYGGKGSYLHGAASRLRDSVGNIVGAIESVRDITERKLEEEERKVLQERLQRAEKMEALGTLAGGVAHDLNNVLGVVIGYSELLLMDADKSRSISPSLVNIMNGAQRAAAIVQDLLTLARRGVSGREVLNLNKIITDCQSSPEFEKLFSYHPFVRIKADLEPDLLNVSGSSVHLGKTLFNLISNASEAMPKGGILTIKTANQYLDKPIHGYDEVREGDYVVLSIYDTGEGIPAADLKRIFEPFYTKKVMGRSGTGLGLAVVWGTVKDHNGYINVESVEGKGSVFKLYFPVTREDITAKVDAISISEYMGKGESVLIVDDVKEQRDLAAGILRKLNYNVSSVSSGEEAIAYLKEHKTDLILLDMIMDPGMDGLDTYRTALEIHPKQKAIIVSGFSESNRVITAQALGAGAYVKKPYVIEKLGLAVKKELDRK